MANFDISILKVLKHEGGWVDNPNDPGGETNFGISTGFIRKENVTAAELGIDPLTMFKPGYLKPMTVDAAKAIYRRCFWDRGGYGNISDQNCATKVFDCAVNCGLDRANKMAQQTANALGAKLVVDGNLGPKSMAAINSLDPTQFLLGMKAQMENHYNAIVVKNPKLGIFLKNWLKRAAWIG